LCCIVVSAQNPHAELWGTYSIRKYIPERQFRIRNDIGARRAFTTSPNTTFLYRPRAIFSIGNYLELTAAADFRYTNYQDTSNVFEIRTWEGAQLHWPQIGRVMFDHVYKFEQRFYLIHGYNKDNISLRSRYRFRMRIPINKRAITERTYYTDLQFEGFFSHDNNVDELFANTVRLGIVAGYNHSVKWRYALQFYVDRGRNEVDNNITNDRAIVSLLVRNTF